MNVAGDPTQYKVQSREELGGRLTRRLLSALLSVALVAHAASAFAVDAPPPLFGVQFRAFSDPPLFQQAHGIDDEGLVAVTTPVFGPVGGIFAATFLDGTFYVVELENGGSREFLGTMPHEGALIGQGQRIGANAVGFDSVEGLAAVDGVLIATSISFSAHTTTLIEINSTTGVGAAIGAMSRNVIIFGLAYDAIGEILYGVGVPFGGDEPSAVDTPNLYRINVSTGAEALVGPLGVDLHSLAWHPTLGLVGGFDQVYLVDSATGAVALFGCEDFTAGTEGNGLYALGAIPPAVEPSDTTTENPRGPSGCPDPVCGNGVLEQGEGCDDGDTSFASGDFCKASCDRVPCGQPLNIDRERPTSSDALYTLKAAVGLDACDKRVCDVDANGSVSAGDALLVLKNAVDIPGDLVCSTTP